MIALRSKPLRLALTVKFVLNLLLVMMFPSLNLLAKQSLKPVFRVRCCVLHLSFLSPLVVSEIRVKSGSEYIFSGAQRRVIWLPSKVVLRIQICIEGLRRFVGSYFPARGAVKQELSKGMKAKG